MILEELFSVRHTKIQNVGIHDSRARSNVFMEKYEPPHEKNNKASAQSDQSLRCPHEESLDP